MLESGDYENLGFFAFFFFFIDKASTFINCEEAFQKHDSQPFLSHRSIKRNIREDN